MKEYAKALIMINPLIENKAKKIDNRLKRLSLDTHIQTIRLAEKMIELVDTKARLANLAIIYKRMVGWLDEREKEILMRRAAGETEESIAIALSVSRCTVSRGAKQALDKCCCLLDGMKKVGIDITDYRDLLAV